MPEVTLRQMRYFVAIVDLGSVTAAAAACHVSQGAASMAVADLEKAVGVTLLVRSRSRKVAPTAAGVEFAAHARTVLEQVEEAQEAVRDQGGAIRGLLRVGVSLTMSPRVVPPLIEHFTTEHPLVELSFVEGAPDALQEQLRAGRLDLALLYSWQTDPDLEQIQIASVRLHVMLPAGHRLADQDSVWLRDIVDEPAVLLDVPPTAERMITTVESAGLAIQVGWRSANMDTIRTIVGRGLGYSFANSIPATGATFDGHKVVYKPVADKTPANAIMAVVPAGQKLPRRVKVAINALKTTEPQR
ncbi:LysR substrate-binding domain-containing protein [Citricoccus sp.]|uniref:LysR family transcriptional regulator n=2 Tax=Citricoccus sp. TaxID=1978372 RepID=UPI002C98D597|nr:LysR substrate-binding domain-containing protein [Citricoccus sp.]HRO94987.1 LysR substrate-binding domain-containing protein [Citricoccus sp.]